MHSCPGSSPCRGRALAPLAVLPAEEHGTPCRKAGTFRNHRWHQSRPKDGLSSMLRRAYALRIIGRPCACAAEITSRRKRTAISDVGGVSDGRASAADSSQRIEDRLRSRQRARDAHSGSSNGAASSGLTESQRARIAIVATPRARSRPKVNTVDFGRAKSLRCRVLDGPKVYTVALWMQKVHTADFWKGQTSTPSTSGWAKSLQY